MGPLPEEHAKLVGFWLALAFMAITAGVGVYDLYALWFLPPGTTVSFYLRTWSSEFPGLPLGLGFVLGHLFFPLPR